MSIPEPPVNDWDGNPYYHRILRVLVYVQEHLDEEVSLDDMARVAQFSPYHFHRVFRGMTGESVKAYVRRLRLERAAHNLTYSDRSVIDIALDAGYEAQESFTRAFRAAFGEPPARYRKSRRPTPRAAAPSGIHYALDPESIEFKPLPFDPEAMEVEIKTLESQDVVFLRHTGPYQECGSAWERLCHYAGPKGLFGPQTRRLGVCYDDPAVVPAEKLRYDACLTVKGEVEVEEPFANRQVPGGEYASTIHVGPYEELISTYGKLMGEWLPRSGREPAHEPCLEIYLNDPWSIPPEQLRTEVLVPLAPA